MLRALFGEPPREWTGSLLSTVQIMERFVRLMNDRGVGASAGVVKYRKYAIWTEGLLRSFDELEQSRYAAERYARLLTKSTVEDMPPAERLNYYRHVYYDKNAYIRIFSLLDKLGVLLNEMLGLATEREKSKFSFFTVLRAMRRKDEFARLADALNEVKEKHRDALNRLRHRRNMEIHHMNAELQDDLLHSLQPYAGAAHLENLKANLSDLDEGLEAVQRILALSFESMCRYGKSMNERA